MNKSVHRRKHRVQEEDPTDEDSDYEGNTEIEIEEDSHGDSWDEEPLLSDIRRRTKSKNVRGKYGKAPSGSNGKAGPRGNTKRRVSDMGDRENLVQTKKAKRTDESRGPPRVYSRSPHKLKKGKQLHSQLVSSAQNLATTTINQPSVLREEDHNRTLQPNRLTNGNTISQYKAPCRLNTSPSTPTQQTPTNSPLPRVTEHNIPSFTIQATTPSQPSFQLIHSEGVQSEPQCSNIPHNSSIPFIASDFSQPGESVHLEGVVDGITQNNAEEDVNRKQFITLDGEHFDPDITRDINRIVIAFWRGPYLNWNQVPIDIKDMWWAQFANAFYWDPHMESGINKLFKKKVSAKIRNFVSRAKLQGKKPSHVTIEDWEEMKIRFTDIKYIDKCQKVQALRRQEHEKGGSTYCGGSIGALEHRKRLVLTLQREPTALELFSKTHKNKKGEWSGARAEKLADAYVSLEKAQEALPEDERKNDRDLWIEAAGGPVNGRVLGLGYVGPQKVWSGTSSSRVMCLELTQQKRWIQEKDAIIVVQQQEIQALHAKTQTLENTVQETQDQNTKMFAEFAEFKSQMMEMMLMCKSSTQGTTVTDGSQPAPV